MPYSPREILQIAVDCHANAALLLSSVRSLPPLTADDATAIELRILTAIKQLQVALDKVTR